MFFTQNGGTNTPNIILLGGSGTYNLNGGTLSVDYVHGGSSTGTFNFNGGILQATSTSDEPFLMGLTVANVQSGGAKIDTNGFNVMSVVQSLLHDTTAGAPAVDGGLTKIGAGILTLLGANTYNGPTTVNAGTLQVGVDGNSPSGTFGNNSAVSLANVSGATLDLNGYNSQIGSLAGGGTTGGNVTLGGATLTVSGNNANPTIFAGAISGTGGLAKLGAGELILYGANTYTGSTTVGAGTLAIAGGSVASATVNVSPGGTLTISGGSVNTGDSTTTFNVGATTGTATATANLSGGTLTTGTLNVASASGTTGVFNQTGGTVTIPSQGSIMLGLAAGAQGTLNVSAGTLDASAAYEVSVGSEVGSRGTVNLSGTGVLKADVLAVGDGANGFFTQSGSSVVTVSSFLGVGDDDGSGNTGLGTYNLQGGTLTTPTTYVGDSNNSAASVFNQIGGTHTINGALQFGYQNTNSAGTYNLSGGTLTVNQVLQNAGTGTFHFNGGTLAAGASATNFFQGLTVADVQAGGAIINTNGFSVTAAQSLVSGTASGTADGGLTKTGTGTLTLAGANTYNGPTTVNAGTLQAGVASVAGTSGAFGNNSAVSLANVSGATLDLNGYATQIGSLTGGGTTGGNVTLGGATLTVGGNNTSPAAFAGVISGTGGLVKTGTGILTLSGANPYSGTTNVNGGTLFVNGTHSGKGLVTVQNSGTVLGGTGTLAAAVSVTTGTLDPGNIGSGKSAALNVGRLTVGALTLSSTATAAFDLLGGTTYDQLFANGNIALGGSMLTPKVTGSQTAYTIGQTLDLFHDNSGALSGVFSNFANNGLYTYDGYIFRANYTATDFTLTVTGAVPEPATWAGGALGLGATVLTLRRRRAVLPG